MRNAIIHRDITEGLSRGMPIVLGYFPIGFAFGILAASIGLNTLEATLMSIFVFAGSAQLISLGLIEGMAGIFTITITTFLVNLRHLLMSAALAPFLGHLSRSEQLLFSYELTDETFAVHSLNFNREETPSRHTIFAVNVSAHLSWVVSTVLGAWLGGLLADFEAWGLDYALPAMFISLLVFQIDQWKKVLIAVLSFGTAIYFALQLGGHWYIMIAAVTGATVGTIIEVLFPFRSRSF